MNCLITISHQVSAADKVKIINKVKTELKKAGFQVNSTEKMVEGLDDGSGLELPQSVVDMEDDNKIIIGYF